jgi:hypothetical protein
MAIKQSNRVVSVLFTTEQLRALRIAAALEDRSMSKLIGRLVLDDLIQRQLLTKEQAYPSVAELTNNDEADEL